MANHRYTNSRRTVTAAAIGAMLAVFAIGCASESIVRAKRTPEQRLAARDAADKKLAETMDASIQRNLVRIKHEMDDFKAGRTTAEPVVHFLIVSGGGDWGAFGAGFLKGWGTVPAGPMTRPKFDAVTGVSTGALIAPFAFLGDDVSYEKIVHLYRNPQKDWVDPVGLFRVLIGGRASFATIPGLEREMRKSLGLAEAKQISEEGAEGRLLAVNTTNIDTGEMCVWDVVAEANRALVENDVKRMHEVLWASASLPGIFPPRMIDGTLYVDGGITGNIVYGGRAMRADKDTFIPKWKAAYPGEPIPKIRYWVIFNNEIRWPPEVVSPRWSSVLAKTSTTATRAATLNAMRLLYLQAENARIEHGADVEVRVVAVPDGWVQPVPGVFKKETMNALADLGEKMGADPSCWRTTAP